MPDKEIEPISNQNFYIPLVVVVLKKLVYWTMKCCIKIILIFLQQVQNSHCYDCHPTWLWLQQQKVLKVYAFFYFCKKLHYGVLHNNDSNIHYFCLRWVMSISFTTSIIIHVMTCHKSLCCVKTQYSPSLYH